MYFAEKVRAHKWSAFSLVVASKVISNKVL